MRLPIETTSTKKTAKNRLSRVTVVKRGLSRSHFSFKMMPCLRRGTRSRYKMFTKCLSMFPISTRDIFFGCIAYVFSLVTSRSIRSEASVGKPEEISYVNNIKMIKIIRFSHVNFDREPGQLYESSVVYKAKCIVTNFLENHIIAGF